MSRETIYSTDRGVQIEIAGYEVLGGLLDIFMSAVNDIATHGDQTSNRSRKLASQLPAECVHAARKTGPYERLMRMLDFVSGMTDSYAVALYRRVKASHCRGRKFPAPGFRLEEIPHCRSQSSHHRSA